MSDFIIQSQIRNEQDKFNVPEQNKVDVLSVFQHGSIVAPMAVNKQYITCTGSENFGQWVEFDIPYCYLAECYLEVTLSALSSGNWTTYPGISLIQEIELLSGSSRLEAFEYQPVFQAMFSRLTSQSQTEILNVSGGTSFASGVCIVPLPLFFSAIAQGTIGKNESPTPLNTNLVSSKLKLRLRYRAASDIADAGATVGSPTISSKLYLLTYETDTNLQAFHMANRDSWKYVTQTYQTLPQGAAVATNTSTSIDLSSFRGSLSELVFCDYLVSNVDTAHDLFLCQNDIDQLEIQIDGKRYYTSISNGSLRFDKMLFSEMRGNSTTLGDPVTVPFSIKYENSSYTGGLSMDSVNKLVAVLRHQAGANAYIRVAALQNITIGIDGNKFVALA